MIKLFSFKIRYYYIAIFLLTLQSCASVEQQQPLMQSTKNFITPNIWTKVNNGSIFQTTTPLNYRYKPLFEDQRAHNIGDIITIVLQENISASNSSFTNASRDGNVNLGLRVTPGELNSIFGINLKDDVTGVDSIGKNNFFGKGSNTAENKFSGLITAVVNNVFPNGNLQVIGEKKVSINEGIELIRFSGIINPNNINKNNVISSTQIANVKLEYITHGRINHMQKMGWLQRLLLKISPI